MWQSAVRAMGGLQGSGSALQDPRQLRSAVKEAVERVPVFDMHTHLFPGSFRELSLWGIDELVTYHYLIAEFFRAVRPAPEQFWRLGKAQQADLIWKALFVERSPMSEAARGVVGVLTALGLDPRAEDLREARELFAAQEPCEHVDRIFRLAGVTDVVMTNDPFDPTEAAVWNDGVERDPRFRAALRLDQLLNHWAATQRDLREWGYDVSPEAGEGTVSELRRFLDHWIARMRPLYAAVSLPADFEFPDRSPRDWLLRKVVLPTCRAHSLPLALMIGVRRGVNPDLGLAADGQGRADILAVERLCREFPDQRFLATMLSRENQYELHVTARKFSNLMVFGCWWFLNNPSLVEEITRQRLELLGTTFIPQHSDARVMEQLIYKWRHTRRTIGEVLAGSYAALLDSGRGVTREEIDRDLRQLFVGNFCEWADTSPSDSLSQARADAGSSRSTRIIEETMPLFMA